MSLLHPASAGAPVGLWTSNGTPARLVHGTDRYRVERAEATETGWIVVARDAAGRSNRFEIAEAATGWELVSAR